MQIIVIWCHHSYSFHTWANNSNSIDFVSPGYALWSTLMVSRLLSLSCIKLGHLFSLCHFESASIFSPFGFRLFNPLSKLKSLSVYWLVCLVSILKSSCCLSHMPSFYNQCGLSFHPSFVMLVIMFHPTCSFFIVNSHCITFIYPTSMLICNNH